MAEFDKHHPCIEMGTEISIPTCSSLWQTLGASCFAFMLGLECRVGRSPYMEIVCLSPEFEKEHQINGTCRERSRGESTSS